MIALVSHMGPDGWGGLMWLAMAAFWILVIAAIVYLIRGHASAPSGGPSALRLLEERYARGEISRGEFVERRAVLSASTPPRPPEAPSGSGSDPGAGGGSASPGQPAAGGGAAGAQQSAPPESATPPGPAPAGVPAPDDEEDTRPLEPPPTGSPPH